MSRRELEELEKKFIVDKLPHAGETVYGELKIFGGISIIRIVDLKTLKEAEDFIKFLKRELKE